MIGIPTDKFRLFINYKEVPIECLNIFCGKGEDSYYIKIEFTLMKELKFDVNKYSVFCQDDIYLVNAYIDDDWEDDLRYNIEAFQKNHYILP